MRFLFSTPQDTDPTPTMDEKPQPLVSKNGKILVVGGGGTLGSSTALHLARRGYTDVRVLDVYQTPSAYSAGNDLNKTAGAGRSGVWGQVGQAAWKAWTTDPLFEPHCHPTGIADVCSGKDPRAADLKAKYDSLVASGRAGDYAWLDNEDDIIRVAPHLKGAHIQGWKGLWGTQMAWVAASDVLNAVGLAAQHLGVKTTFGTSGTFKEPLLSADGKRCVGVRAVDGTEWDADLVVFAAGAWSPVLLDLEGQCVSKCWVYAHIQLTPEETLKMRNISTMYHHKLGFFIEPSPTGLLKLCNEFPGYTNLTPSTPYPLTTPTLLSSPRAHADHPTDTIPTESLLAIEKLIKVCLPWLEGRELVKQGMCWCTDTEDGNWLLCEDPRWEGLVLMTGDSGHSFNTLPQAGNEVVDLIEGTLSEEKRSAWKWRPGRGDPDGTGRAGGPPKDLNDLPGWKHGDE
ncbi:hypothetical protein L198_07822 [Cryptococcus wingfieldii CBS 7118]|uniref:Rhodanese domain-containing protein n=1 Tax=Cryptococcus wingfieldii CBS 7118 TaxID=1295528 RepID=A0A1E3HVH0_9TREE|nr:hypothetical protein L198_07822 [Cryptococcus wingfieldii CBS 7118]ODN80322.1 hypothetical protein L198_07822 [Cryptococcus wingfieldii CBS 7118]